MKRVIDKDQEATITLEEVRKNKPEFLGYVFDGDKRICVQGEGRYYAFDRETLALNDRTNLSASTYESFLSELHSFAQRIYVFDSLNEMLQWFMED